MRPSVENLGHKIDSEVIHALPLTAILRPKKEIPSLAAACLQSWAIVLSAYQYDIVFEATDDHTNADGLSRLPLPHNPSDSRL